MCRQIQFFFPRPSLSLPALTLLFLIIFLALISPVVQGPSVDPLPVFIFHPLEQPGTIDYQSCKKKKKDPLKKPFGFSLKLKLMLMLHLWKGSKTRCLRGQNNTSLELLWCLERDQTGWRLTWLLENSPVNFALTGIACQYKVARNATKWNAEVISNTGNLYWRSVCSL